MTEREIFEAALEIEDAERRREFLDQACGGDPKLRARLAALLTTHDRESQFLKVPALEQFRSVVPDSDSSPTKVSQDDGKMDRGPQGSDEDNRQDVDLSFLLPSSNAGSIGRLGHYEILQVLGQGAFGIVFRAFDEKLHRYVAIKALDPRLAATSPPRKRFLREARSVAAIKHENIVQVYSVEEQPLPYLVMEYVDGETLQQKLDSNGPLDVAEILHLGRQVASGLAASHAQGLIHRDIKPGNILLEKGVQQKVKITDFGLARAADDASLTSHGLICGTPLYMAPEQAQGHALDHRADLFSLGSMLYQMASGRPPFRASSAIAVLQRVVHESPRPIAQIIPDVPDWLCAIIAKLHAKNPADRFQSAQELADLLARCQAEWQLNGQVNSMALPHQVDDAEIGPKAAHADVAAHDGQEARSRSRRPAPQPFTVSRWHMLAGLLGLIALAAIIIWNRDQVIPVATSANDLPKPPANALQTAMSPADGSRVTSEQEDGNKNVVAPASSAVELNGTTDWIQLPLIDDREGALTIEAYVQPVENQSRLATIAAAFVAPRGTGMSIFENQLEAAISFGDEATWSTAKTGKLPDAQKPSHVAAVFDGRMLKVFLNGKLSAQSEPPQVHTPSQGRFCLGGFEGRDLFAGRLDEVRFSRIARYDQDFSPLPRFQPDADTLTLYHCDEGTGDVLQDSSGNEKHGKIFGAKWVADLAPIR